tara:strand:+ start:1235 stop:1345 length:111 start_codon:yes stop_codon:yes gene_type:complete
MNYWIKEALKWCDPEHDNKEYVHWLAKQLKKESEEE